MHMSATFLIALSREGFLTLAPGSLRPRHRRERNTEMPEANVRNPARDKVMRKEADIRKACSDFRDPSGNS